MSTSNDSKIMVFRPSYAELRNFSSFVKYMESCGAHEAGIAKIIPPRAWKPRKKGYEISKLQLMLRNPIQQNVIGRAGIYKLIHVSQKPVSVSDYCEKANSVKYKPPENDLEKSFWKNIRYTPPIYGADVPGSLFDDETWNFQKLGTILDYVKKDTGATIPGVNTPFLYVGMWRALFGWHVEDYSLYSINYLHFGSPKMWYSIPPKYGQRFEQVASSLFPEDARNCPAFLTHKMHLISPSVLRANAIPCHKIVQEEGEIIVTFPFSYHSGFNQGLNCAESINFASKRWIEYGKWAQRCSCRKDCVRIEMDIFVKRFQPERYFLWKRGYERGHHPEDERRRTRFIPGKKRKSSFVTVNLEHGKVARMNVNMPKWQPMLSLKRISG